MSEKTKQTGLFDELNHGIKRVKNLSKTAKRISEITLKDKSAGEGMVSLKLSTSVLTENLAREDVELIVTEFNKFTSNLSEILNINAKELLKDQTELL